MRKLLIELLSWLSSSTKGLISLILRGKSILLFSFTKLGYELFPKTDVGQMEILIRKESGTPLRTTEKTIAKMEKIKKNLSKSQRTNKQLI